MIKKFTATCTAITLLTGTALTMAAASSPQEGATNQAPPLSELDALSQRNDDPFGDIIIEKSRKPISVTLRALDKIIARTTDIEVPMNEIAQFGTLELVPRYCDKRPPEDFPETTAFIEVFDKGLGGGLGDNDTPKTANDGSTPENSRQNETSQPITKPVILAEPNIGPNTEGERIFTGWMFASSPALNALEHPVYDVWVIDCKTQLVENSVE